MTDTLPRHEPRVAGRFTRRLCATALLAQAMCVFFGALVAWQLTRASEDPSPATAYLIGGCVLALACVLAAGTLRTRWGMAFGWVLQALTLATALVLPAMLIVALIFGGLWWLCSSQGAKLDRLATQHEGS